MQQRATHRTPGRRDPATRFREEMEYRINRIFDDLDRIERLANPKTSEYTPEEVRAAFGAIEGKVAETKRAFSAGSLPRSRFTFNGPAPQTLQAGGPSGGAES